MPAETGSAPSPGIRTKMPREAYLLFVGLFFAVASNNLATPLLPAIRHDMAVSVAAMGAFVSTYGLARLIVDLPSGALTSRIGHRPVVVTGVLLNAVASAGAMLAPRFDLLIAARIAAGLVATVVLSALSEVAPTPIRGRVMSLYQVANNLGIGLYPLAGGAIGSLLGWRGVRPRRGDRGSQRSGTRVGAYPGAVAPGRSLRKGRATCPAAHPAG